MRLSHASPRRQALLLLLVSLALFSLCGVTSGQNVLRERPDDRDKRMTWWREARFGMFIHWGLYAVPAGEWKGEIGYGEWIRTSAQIPLETYDRFREQFNPERFDARAWARAAKNAGMKYVVITSKHHDGFCLFDSRVSDFTVMQTPFRRDILKELSQACREEGLKFCCYYSIMDWHHPDYLPRREWEKNRPAGGADYDRYVAYAKSQLKELITNYGPLGVLWFDGEWESTWNHDRGNDLYNYVRSLQPDIIINNRVGAGRSGMAGFNEEGEFAGDFGTPEQEIPATGLPGVDWETCMTMNDHWGFNKADSNFKSADSLIRMLVDIASKGGNFLLNVGPTADGLFPEASIRRLAAIGTWMTKNSESIYGTTASPFHATPWGRCTQKQLPDGSWRLYLHLFGRQHENLLVCPGIGSLPLRDRVRLLAAPAEPLHWLRAGDTLIVELPRQSGDPVDEVVTVDFAERPVIYHPPALHAPAPVFIDRMEVTITPPEGSAETRYTLDGTIPTAASPLYRGAITIDGSCAVSARTFAEGRPVGETVKASYEKRVPAPPAAVRNPLPGLEAAYAEGDWDRVPRFDTLRILRRTIVPVVDLRARKENEHFGLQLTGFLNVGKDGVYRIVLTSDDGSTLQVDHALAIDNDGLHGSTSREAFLPLAKGMHPITVSYFNKTGGLDLRLQWAVPGAALTDLDASMFVHEGR